MVFLCLILVYLLWNSVLSCLDLGEKFLWHHIIERKLPIQHGKENHPQGPHITGLPQVGFGWKQRGIYQLTC